MGATAAGRLTVQRQPRLLLHQRAIECLLFLLSVLPISFAPAYAESQAEREPSEGANWKGFRSDNYGVSFEYPPPWHRDDGGEQLGNPDIRVYLVSPDTSIQTIYTGGDFPSKMIWHNGATLEFEVWRRTTLAPRVFDDLQRCLAKASLSRKNLYVDLMTHWKWPRCPDQEASAVGMVHGDIVSIAGQKALRYEFRHPKHRIPEENVNIVHLWLIHPNDQLLVAIKFATVATKRDTYLKIFERILSTVRFRHFQTGALSPGSPERPLEGPLITVYAPRPERFELALDEIVLDWGDHPGTPAQSAVATPYTVVVEREALLALVAVPRPANLLHLLTVAGALKAANPGAEFHLVLYAPGRPKTRATRGLLTREVGLILEQGADPLTAVGSLPVVSIRPEAVSGGYVIEAEDPLAALRLAAALRGRPGVKEAYLRGRPVVPR